MMSRRHHRRIAPVMLAALAFFAAAPAGAAEVFATSFFSPASGDPDPGLSGVLKIDLETGAASTFIAESPTGLLQPTDAVVNPASNTLYVSTQGGTIWHYDATTGAPLASLVGGAQAGTFAVLPTADFGDGVNSLLLDGGELFAATAFGSITPFNTATGIQGADLAMGLSFPSGMAMNPDGSLTVSTGDPFGGPGELMNVIGGVATTIVAADAPLGVLGASNPTLARPLTDYDGNGAVAQGDYGVWASQYGQTLEIVADGNRDGVIDAIDYTLWRDSLGEESRLLVADLNGNKLASYALDGSDGQLFAVIPPDIPDPLPPTANPLAPSNSPSEVLETPEGTLLVSTLGLTRRPDNRGALLEYDRDGTLLGTIADGLPPLSGIALVPEPASSGPVPEPSTLVLLTAGWAMPYRSRRERV